MDAISQLETGYCLEKVFLIPVPTHMIGLDLVFTFGKVTVKERELAEEAIVKPGQTKGIILEPAVIGAVIDLGYCCDLMNRRNIEMLKAANQTYLSSLQNGKSPLLNRGELPDMKGRYRDCAVINALHELIRINKTMRPFDTVRSVFFEGNAIYDTSAFREYTHIQICVRNPNCIKAVFDPREPDADHAIP